MKKKLFPIVAIGLVLWLVLRPKKAAKPIPYGAPGNAQNGANAAAAGKALQQQQQTQSGWLGDLFKAVGSIAKSVGGGGGSSGGGSVAVGKDSTSPAGDSRPRKTASTGGGGGLGSPLDDTFSGWSDPLDNIWNYPEGASPSDPQGTFYGWSDPLDNPWNYPSPLDGNGLDATEPDYGPAEFSPGDVSYQFLDSGPYLDSGASYASFPFQPAAAYVPNSWDYGVQPSENSFGYPGSYTPVASPFAQSSDPFASSIHAYDSWGSGSFGIPTFDNTYED